MRLGAVDLGYLAALLSRVDRQWLAGMIETDISRQRAEAEASNQRAGTESATMSSVYKHPSEFGLHDQMLSRLAARDRLDISATNAARLLEASARSDVSTRGPAARPDTALQMQVEAALTTVLKALGQPADRETLRLAQQIFGLWLRSNSPQESTRADAADTPFARPPQSAAAGIPSSIHADPGSVAVDMRQADTTGQNPVSAAGLGPDSAVDLNPVGAADMGLDVAANMDDLGAAGSGSARSEGSNLPGAGNLSPTSSASQSAESLADLAPYLKLIESAVLARIAITLLDTKPSPAVLRLLRHAILDSPNGQLPTSLSASQPTRVPAPQGRSTAQGVMMSQNIPASPTTPPPQASPEASSASLLRASSAPQTLPTAQSSPAEMSPQALQTPVTRPARPTSQTEPIQPTRPAAQTSPNSATAPGPNAATAPQAAPDPQADTGSSSAQTPQATSSTHTVQADDLVLRDPVFRLVSALADVRAVTRAILPSGPALNHKTTSAAAPALGQAAGVPTDEQSVTVREQSLWQATVEPSEQPPGSKQPVSQTVAELTRETSAATEEPAVLTSTASAEVSTASTEVSAGQRQSPDSNPAPHSTQPQSGPHLRLPSESLPESRPGASVDLQSDAPPAKLPDSRSGPGAGTPPDLRPDLSTDLPPVQPSGSPSASPIQQLLSLRTDALVPLYVEGSIQTQSGPKHMFIVIESDRGGLHSSDPTSTTVHLSIQTDNLGVIGVDLTSCQGISCTISASEEFVGLVHSGLPLLRQSLVDSGLTVVSLSCHQSLLADIADNTVAAAEASAAESDAQLKPATKPQVDVRA